MQEQSVSQVQPQERPVVALMTDFGLGDGDVGVMKGVIAGIAPQAQIIDITHEIAPQNVASPAWILSTAYRYFPVGTVFVCVITPALAVLVAPSPLPPETGSSSAPIMACSLTSMPSSPYTAPYCYRTLPISCRRSAQPFMGATFLPLPERILRAASPCRNLAPRSRLPRYNGFLLSRPCAGETRLRPTSCTLTILATSSPVSRFPWCQTCLISARCGPNLRATTRWLRSAGAFLPGAQLTASRFSTATAPAMLASPCATAARPAPSA